MSIQKKSLINTLKSAKKANVVKEEVTISGATASPVKVLPRVAGATRRARVAGATKRARVAGATKRARAISPRIVVD